jgi:hypothetical protein
MRKTSLKGCRLLPWVIVRDLAGAKRLTSSSRRQDTRWLSALVIVKLRKRLPSIGRIAGVALHREVHFLTARLPKSGTGAMAKTIKRFSNIDPYRLVEMVTCKYLPGSAPLPMRDIGRPSHRTWALSLAVSHYRRLMRQLIAYVRLLQSPTRRVREAFSCR